MVTINQIAKEANVSKMTVSNVINKRYNKVSDATREKVEALLKQYHYTPNLNARSLVNADSKMIAVIEYAEDDEDASIYFNDPFMAELLAAIDTNVTNQHFFTMIRHVTSVEEITILRKNWNLAGAIVVGLNPKYFEKLMMSLNVPTVFIDSFVSRSAVDSVFRRARRSMCFINSDDFNGARMATNHLIEKGCQKVGFLGFQFNSPGVVSERLDGYMQALSQADMPLVERRVIRAKNKGKLDPEFKRIGQLVTKHELDGLFVTSDLAASQLLHYLHENTAVRVPTDLALIGFDNMYFSSWMVPALSTVSQDIIKQGQMAVDFLTKVKSGSEARSEFINLPVSLVLRESTGD